MRTSVLLCVSVCVLGACGSNDSNANDTTGLTCGTGTHADSGTCVPDDTAACSAGAACDCTTTNGTNEVLIDCPGYSTVHVPMPAPQQATLVITGTAASCGGGGVTIQVNDATGVPQTQTVCFVYCGNGTVDDGEECDDGGNVDLDGCSHDCKAEPQCAISLLNANCTPPRYYISALSTVLAPTQGGSQHTITGVFPSGTAVVGNGTTPLTVVSADTSSVTFVAAPGSGTVTLTLTIDGVTIPTYLPHSGVDGRFMWTDETFWPFTYQAPTVTTVGGCSAAPGCNGGDTLTVNGTNFGSAAADITVAVGGDSCTDVAITMPHTDISCTVPTPGAQRAGLPIVVTVRGQASQSVPLVDYSGPHITPGTLRLQGGSPSALLDIPDPPPQTIELDGSFAGTVITVDAIVGDLTLPCTPVVAASTTLSCTLDAYFGALGRFRVTVDGAQSPLSDDQWVAPQASPIAGTLRVNGTSVTSPAILLANTGVHIVFDAKYVPPRPGWLVGNFGGNPCTSFVVTPIGPVSSTVECDLGLGSGGGPLQWTILGRSGVDGTDSVLYPVAAALTSVSGCEIQIGSETHGCPTTGGGQLTLTGGPFSSGVVAVVTVGASLCESVSYVDVTTLTCTLPPGVGDAPVRVDAAGSISNAIDLSYAAPHIDAITGCDSGCSSGDLITLTGTDFGASGGTVLVGDTPCSNVEHDTNTPHQQMTCTLPDNSGRDLPVYIVNGGVSNVVYVSY